MWEGAEGKSPSGGKHPGGHIRTRAGARRAPRRLLTKAARKEVAVVRGEVGKMEGRADQGARWAARAREAARCPGLAL